MHKMVKNVMGEAGWFLKTFLSSGLSTNFTCGLMENFCPLSHSMWDFYVCTIYEI